jgi:NAD dependent epimerase/dehydratase family enzyme
VGVDDVVGIVVAALASREWSGPINATAPEPVTNRELSRALGRALHRPAVAPVPGAAIKLLYGEMAQVVTTGQRAVPARALELGYGFAHADLDEALHAALERG